MFPAGILRFFRILFLSLGGIGLGAYGIGKLLILLPDLVPFDLSFNFTINTAVFSGISLIFFPIGFSILFFEIFGGYYLKNPKYIKQEDNMAELLDFDTARIFAKSLSLSHKMQEDGISTDSLLLSILSYKPMEEIFLRIGLNAKSARQGVEKITGIKPKMGTMAFFGGAAKLSPELDSVFLEAQQLSQKHKGKKITSLDLLLPLFDHNQLFKKLIIDLNLDQNDLEELALWYEKIWDYRNYRKMFWRLDNLLRRLPIGKDWVYGYSWHLKNFAVNLSDQLAIMPGTLHLASRKKEMEHIEQILARSGENNVLLVGQEGVGKRTVVEDFVRLINHGKALPNLNYKKVFELNMSAIAASDSPAEAQKALTKLLDESSRAGNIVLIIENFHNFIGSKTGLGRIDASEILVPYLKSSNIQVIATTNPIDFHKSIESRGDLMQVFERINVEEPDNIQTIRIIEEAVPKIEFKSGILVTYSAIKAIVEGADKFIRSNPFPEKAFDLLSEAVSYALSERKRIIIVSDINEVISRKTDIPLGPIGGEEKDKLANLEQLMHEKIIGQKRAVEVVASTMRRLRTGLAKEGKPAGVFLFVGPTGVGKTLTSKILAEIYFGSQSKMLRFDMSEYQDIESLDRFLGSLRNNEPGQFITQVMDNPFSLILLDEIEKAHKDVLNIFLQVFDEGRLTDAFGRKINFEQNIIIATSNAGAGFIRDLIKQNIDPSLEKEKIVNTLIKGGNFRPEFLNRFDEIVIFHPLSPDQIRQIADLMLHDLAERMLEKNYEFKPTPDIADYIAKIGFDPQFGARPMQRAIQDKVENVIAKKILDGAIEKGKPFSLSVEDVK